MSLFLDSFKNAVVNIHPFVCCLKFDSTDDKNELINRRLLVFTIIMLDIGLLQILLGIADASLAVGHTI